MLQELVNQYLRAFPTEKQRLRSLLELLSEVSDDRAVSRDNRAGHITASGLVMSTSRRHVLRLHHKKHRCWLQPGGHIQPNDGSPLNAAIREISEETHFASIDHVAYHPDDQVPIDIDIHEIQATDAEPGHRHYDFRFLFVCRDESEFKLNEEEFDRFDWHQIGELMQSATFRELKPKIERALSNEFRAKLFFDKMIHLTKPTQACCSVVVAHVVPDAKVFLRALNVKAPIVAAIPKPSSKDDDVVEELGQDFQIIHISREDIRTGPDAIGDLILKVDAPCALFDIGGYFAPIVNSLKDRHGDKLLGVIEDTENGYQKYKAVSDLRVPVISVARSPLKENEDFLVGQSILYSADAILRELGFNIEYQTCGIFGYGKIGASIAQHLLMRNVKPMVFDTNPIRRIVASNRMCIIPSRGEIIAKANVIFCATGNHVLGLTDFEQLKPGCVVCSVTSADDELDLLHLDKFTHEKVTKHVDKYISYGNYFYLLNGGNAVNFVHKPALGSYIHLVRAEMMYSLNKLTSGSVEPGLQDLSEQDRAEVANAWLSIYAAPPSHNDLGIAG